MTILLDEDKLQDQIIEAYQREPIEGKKGAVMMTFEDEKDSVSIEVIPYLNEWGADLTLSNNFSVAKHSNCFMRTTNFLERKLGIMQFNVFDSHGAALNGFDFERQYLIDRHKDNPEMESIMKEWENQKIALERRQ
jgi:hypothetical protein